VVWQLSPLLKVNFQSLEKKKKKLLVHLFQLQHLIQILVLDESLKASEQYYMAISPSD